jgi:beta-glucosidase
MRGSGKDSKAGLEFIFPKGFLWASASSAFQVEGGCTNHDFYDWAVQGRIRDGTNPVDAVHFWKYYRKDIALMKKMNHSAARIGLEWARIEPEAGSFDEKALAHYRAILAEMIKSGIRPMVSIHHFSNPMWFVRTGGWAGGDAVRRFAFYTERVVKALGDLVHVWITINEPAVYAVSAYLFGEFPPGKKSFRQMFRVQNAMADAHSAAYDIIHGIHGQKKWSAPLVGVAKHLRTFDPYNERNPLDRFSAGLADKYFNNYFLERVMRNKSTLDVFGINYYSGDLVKFPLAMKGREELPKNKLGWDIYPAGYYRVLMRYWEMYKLPIYVTENGTCDDHDELRPRYILDHVAAMHRAISGGAKVAGYYHWSTTDNFELVDGLMSRFGLIHVDHEHPERKRTIKRSGELYREISKANGITPAIVKKYVPEWTPGF